MQIGRSNYGNLTKLMNDLNVRHSIQVGIIGQKALQIHEGSGMTNAKLGTIHEFGATINHPGGQPYFIDDETGQCRFVKKDSELGRKLIARGQVTKAHTIYIPTRSFLRMPLLSNEGKKYILKELKKIGFEFKGDYEDLKKQFSTGGSGKAFSENISHLIAIAAWDRVAQAFETGGFGKWAKPTAATMANRKSNHEPNPLLDTGQLRDSIGARVDGQEIKFNGSKLRG